MGAVLLKRESYLQRNSRAERLEVCRGWWGDPQKNIQFAIFNAKEKERMNKNFVKVIGNNKQLRI